ncbi:MAG: hypothetical protein ACKVT2_10810 [Saprospiraceae bacterium]
MENNFMLTDDMLWDYADGFLLGEEKNRVDAYLRLHPEHQARLDAIFSEKRVFSTMNLEKPNADFAQKVMLAWAAEQSPEIKSAKANGRDWILWGMALSFGLLVGLSFLIAPAAAPTEFTWPEQYMPQVQVPSFDWRGILESPILWNALLLTVAFMGLKLLDKYLQVRNLRLSGQ